MTRTKLAHRKPVNEKILKHLEIVREQIIQNYSVIYRYNNNNSHGINKCTESNLYR